MYLQSYVNCALGVHRIGFVIVAYGAVSAVASVAVGHVTAKHIRRVYVVISGATFNAGLLLALAWWTPTREDPAMFYVVAGCLGLCDAIWQTQTNSKCGFRNYSSLFSFIHQKALRDTVASWGPVYKIS